MEKRHAQNGGMMLGRNGNATHIYRGRINVLGQYRVADGIVYRCNVMGQVRFFDAYSESVTLDYTTVVPRLAYLDHTIPA